MDYLMDVFLANLNIVARAGGFFSAMPGLKWEHPSYLFEQNKFYYITSGECSITILGKTYDAKPGMWFFIPAGAEHSYHNYSGRPFEKYWMHFDLYPDTKFFDTLNLPFFVLTNDSQEQEKLFSKYVANKKSESLTDKIENKALLLMLLKEYINLAKISETQFNIQPQDTLSSVLSYINENLDKPLTNEDMAEICHMHPNHFPRYFKLKTSQSPHTYIMQKRMESAKRLLEQTQMSISHIAEKTGMWDTAHLSKTFKRFYNISPKEYRKNMYIEEMD